MMTEPFEASVERHAGTVLRVCRAVLGPGADADDAWSETFLAALRAWPEMDADTNIEAWLVRVAHRKAIDVTRARARRAVPVAHVDDPKVPRTDPAVDHTHVWDAVAALPQKQRLAVAYHYLGGLPHTATAELIGSTPAAVRRASADGIRSLRAAMCAAPPPATTPARRTAKGAAQ